MVENWSRFLNYVARFMKIYMEIKKRINKKYDALCLNNNDSVVHH